MTKTEDTSMRVLKTATCKTISGKSTLTYQISVNQDDAIYIRITGNDGGGFHSSENVAFEDIQEALKDDNEGAAITSIRLTLMARRSQSRLAQASRSSRVSGFIRSDVGWLVIR